jgi:mannose-6-phosphate isomerase-like protein (cupin superfamily)
MKKKYKSIIFPKKKDLGSRIWGKEILLTLIPKVLSLKLLKMKKGSKGGLQYHHKKNECGYIMSGKLKLRYINNKKKLVSRILKKGDVFHFPPGAIHQEEALTRCEIIEASTPHFNDRVRVERKFRIKCGEGLPSTKFSEVKLL